MSKKKKRKVLRDKIKNSITSYKNRMCYRNVNLKHSGNC